MKKLSAIILVAAMLLCSSVVSVGAIGPVLTYKISYGETITVSIPDSKLFGFAIVEYIPEESGYYAFSSSSDGIDPYCMLMDGKEAEVLEINDDCNGLDFCLKYEFKAGKLYYFAVYNSYGAAEFDVTLGCSHSFIDGICENCSEACAHSPIRDNFGYCECGTEFYGTDINDGDTFSYNYDEENEWNNIFRFVPESDGVYVFSSESDEELSDPAIDIYNEEKEYVDFADDENGYDFYLACEFQAGKTYYIVLSDYSEESHEINVTVKKAIHEAEDGSVHDLIATPEIYPTCTEVGYTQGLFCEICDEYIYGHEEIEVEPHWDINGDGYCEMCEGEVPLPDCSHICHSNNKVISFIWKIINYFNKLFYINPFCECGCYHFY